MYGKQTDGVRERLEYRISTGDRYKNVNPQSQNCDGGRGRRLHGKTVWMPQCDSYARFDSLLAVLWLYGEIGRTLRT